jgi:hypothetical protein
MSEDGTGTTATVHKIKERIDLLTEQQGQALKSATYLGMTPEEAQDYDQRRAEILKLVQQLETLEKSQ